MNRNQRSECAKQTVAICETGFYLAPDARRVELAQQINRAIANTVL